MRTKGAANKEGSLKQHTESFRCSTEFLAIVAEFQGTTRYLTAKDKSKLYRELILTAILQRCSASMIDRVREELSKVK